MSNKRVIHWFRQDLRLKDNPALCHAAQAGDILPIYILDNIHAGAYAMGGASRWWLHHSLAALNESLQGKLNLYIGDPEQIIPELIKRHNIRAVYWNRCYEPWRIERDARIKNALKAGGIVAESANGSLLWEPWKLLKEDGTPYKVFTPFYRKGCLDMHVREPMGLPSPLRLVQDTLSVPLPALKLLPSIRWDKQLEPHWNIGELGAHTRLKDFLDAGITQYKEGRNFPSKPYTSRLSPYLHFGEISPHQLWYNARMRAPDANIDCFCTELGWREFSYYLLYHFPALPSKNWQVKFDAFPWKEDINMLKSWQKGQTGYPIIDAGMRELWQTGYMHNRVRMIVGSFLVKNLLLDWRQGERWFWDCLVDADLASNSASWQWVAGSGADAAPYFRIFNPITQGEKFDTSGEYTRRFVPELALLPDRYLFKPWKAPQQVLVKAKVTLGDTYPYPVVDIMASRKRALAAFSKLSGGLH